MRRLAVPLGLVILLHAVASWFLINRNGLEPISDEGAYVTLAKALATTGDYRMISLPGEPYHTKYPILFPWLLSRIWGLYPDFPANVTQLRSLNIVFGVGFLIALFPLFTKLCEGSTKQALLLVSLCAINPSVLSSSTTLSSEASYLFFSTVCVLAVLRLDRPDWSPFWLALTLIGLAAAFYVRISAVALLVGVEVHFLLRKQFREAIWIGLGAALLVAPWLLWCHAHNDSARFPEYIFYNDYISDFWQFIAAHGVAALLAHNAVYVMIGIPKLLIFPFQADLRVITQLVAGFGLVAIGLLVLGFVRSYQRPENRLIHWYAVTYIVMLLLWPYPAGERFLEPLLPFFYWFIFVEVRHFLSNAVTHFHADARLLSKTIPAVLALCIASAWAIGALFCLGLHTVRFSSGKWHELAAFETNSREMNESFRWLQKETRPSDSLTANLYPLYYLHTGRKTAPLLFDSARKLTEPRFDERPIWKHGIQYLIVGNLDFGVYVPAIMNAMRQELRRVIEADEGLRFERKFVSQFGNYEVYEIERTTQRP
jgi:4-amino-4-deoxy-L-arabinose transferase-like glycosyltransferase